jgi:hypothetical protein
MGLESSVFFEKKINLGQSPKKGTQSHMSRFNERKKEEGRKAPSPVMHQNGARQLRARVR